MTQIRRIEVDAEKHRQEVLTTTNVIQDAIKKNNVIFSNKWEATHDHIDCHTEDILLLKNRVVDLEALSGLQQTALQSCQNTIARLEETVAQLTTSVTSLEKSICQCRDRLLSLAPHYMPEEEEEVVEETEEEEEEGLEYTTVIVMTFWYVYRNGLTFFELFKLYSSLGIDHDPPCSLCSHDLCLSLFLMFHSSHDHMAKRSHYRIMIFLTSEYY